MPNCVILVDNSNIFIEGQKSSAVRRGLQAPAGSLRTPQDVTWRIDFSALLRHLADGRPIQAAILVGSRPPQNDAVWQMAENSGFKVTVYDRNAANKEKADTELVARGTLIIARSREPGILVIASGDRDFIPLVTVAHECGWTVEMAAFRNSFTANGEMATAVDAVRRLDGALDLIGHIAALATAGGNSA